MANRFWILGTGSWSDTAHWSAASGGAGGASKPTSSDNVYFDANSDTGGPFTVTVDATAYCADMDWSGADQTPTLAGNALLAVDGSLTLVAGMTVQAGGTIQMTGSGGTDVVTSSGVVLLKNFFILASGSTIQLADDLEIAGAYYFYLQAGSFDANSHALILSGTTQSVHGGPTLYDLTRTGTASKTCELTFNANITVTNNLTINGNSSVNRLLVASNTIGTPRTITAANVSVSNADFRDITGAGAGSWDFSAQTDIGNAGGNTGLTFPAALDIYWYKASGNDNASTTTNYYLGAGGTGGAARFPLLQDTVKFQGGFGAASMTLTQDMPRIGSRDWTGATNTPTWTTSTVAEVYGSITLIDAMVLTASTQTYTFMGRGAYELTSAGKTWAKDIDINSYSGTLTLQDAFNIAGKTLRIRSGELDDGNNNITIGVFYAQYTPQASLTLGASSLLTVTSATSNYAWYVTSSDLNITPGGSTIKLTRNAADVTKFEGSDLTYNNLCLSPSTGTGGFQILSSNTFADFKDDGTEAHSILFTPATTTTVSSWDVSGSAGKLKTIGSIGGAAAHTLSCPSGIIDSDYLDISYSEAGGGASWYAGSHSVNSGNNDGWIFSDAPKAASLSQNNELNKSQSFDFQPSDGLHI